MCRKAIIQSINDFVTTSEYVVPHSNGLTRMYQIVNSLSSWANTQHRLHTVHQECHRDPSLGRCFLLHTCRQLLTSFPVKDCCFTNTLTTHNSVAAKAKVDIADVLMIVSSCTHAVQSWSLLNDLLLNPDNSEVMVMGTRTQLKAYPC